MVENSNPLRFHFFTADKIFCKTWRLKEVDVCHEENSQLVQSFDSFHEEPADEFLDGTDVLSCFCDNVFDICQSLHRRA